MDKPYDEMDEEDSLAHYGVVGMRWGIRRYQPYSYTSNRDGGKHRGGKEVGIASKLGDGAKAFGRGAKKAGKAVVKATKKGAEAAVEFHKARKAARDDKKRQSLINSGTPEQIRANRGKLLSENDVKAAIDRMRNDNTLRDMESQEALRSIKRGKEAIDTYVGVAKSIYDAYDTTRKITNTVKDAKKAAEREKSGVTKEINDAIQRGDWKWLNDNMSKLTDDDLKRAATNSKLQDTMMKVANKNDDNDSDGNTNNTQGQSKKKGQKQSQSQQQQPEQQSSSTVRPHGGRRARHGRDRRGR